MFTIPWRCCKIFLISEKSSIEGLVQVLIRDGIVLEETVVREWWTYETGGV